MKVKRFKNLWAMGLLLFGAILIAFYVAKIFFPQFIIGVAELPSIVKFGNYVDSHKWANILFNFVISYLSGYIYYCACYRKYKLDLIDNLFLNGLRVGDFARLNPKGTYLIRIQGHLTCLIDGKIYDTWDCLDRMCDIVWKVA